MSDIDIGDESYRITTNRQSTDLAGSIGRIGLIHAPILFQKEHAFVIVSGFRRINACAGLDRRSVQAFLVEPDSSELDRVCLAITENATQRALNLIELSRACQKLSRLIEDENEFFRIVRILGIDENRKYIKKVLKVGHMPGPLQDSILDHSISLPMALELEFLDSEEILKIIAIFRQIKGGLNIQREILVHMREIARRENTSIQAILDSRSIAVWLEDPNQDRAVKTKKIRKYLKERRYPELSGYENQFNHVLSQFNHLGVDIIPPKHFEGTVYQVNLSFRNPEELESKTAALQKIIENQEFLKIMK